jgi:uncharacterized OsmC-like protein
MMSVMAIASRKEGIDLSGMSCQVEKHMSADLPRRIVKLDVEINLPKALTADQRARLQEIGDTCPVIQSLHQGISIHKNYHYQ